MKISDAFILFMVTFVVCFALFELWDINKRLDLIEQSVIYQISDKEATHIIKNAKCSSYQNCKRGYACYTCRPGECSCCKENCHCGSQFQFGAPPQQPSPFAPMDEDEGNNP
jgi:hypothetical protein